MPEPVGDTLRALRLGQGLSTKAMADYLGCSKSHLNQVELGKAHPSIRFVERVSSLLGLELSNGHRSLEKGRPRLASPLSPEHFFGRSPRRALPGGPLRQNFQECCWDPVGAALVRELDARRRGGLFWKAIKYLAREQNGVEQGAMLQMLLPDGDLHECHPHALGFPCPVLESPRHWWVAVTAEWEGRLLLAFPQLVLSPRVGCLRRIDFMLAAGDGRRVVHANLEVDGPTHRARRLADKARDGELPFPTLRVGAHEVWSKGFRRRILGWVDTLLQK